MMGPTHLIFGALSGAAVATYNDESTTVIVTSTVIATAVAHGKLSPDMDLSGAWRAVAKFIPLPLRGIAGHRYGLSHWVGIPVLFWWFVVSGQAAHTQWVFVALLAGWSSHLVGDFIFGKLCLTPWGAGPKLGLDLDTDGFLESGKLRLWGRERRVIPFGPTRVVLTVALVWVLLAPFVPVLLVGWPTVPVPTMPWAAGS